MPRVRCPECDKLIRIPDDYERATVRCPSCEYKIRLDDDDDAPPPRERSKSSRLPATSERVHRPARESPRRAAKVRKRSRSPNQWVGNLLPASIIAAVSVMLLGVGAFVPVVLMSVALLGLLIPLAAFIMGIIRARQGGNFVSIDYLEFLGPIRFVVIFLFLGLYFGIYGLLWQIAQIREAINKPMVMLPWLFLQGFGVVLLIACGILAPRPAVHPPMNAGNQPRIAANFPPNQPPVVAPNNPKVEIPPKIVPPAPRVTGDAELDILLADIAGGDANARRIALERLAQMQPNEHRAIVAAKLGAMVQSPEPAMRRTAVEPLKVWATTAEVPILIRLLGEPDVSLRNEVLKVIGTFRDPRTVAPVVSCLKELSTQYHAERALKTMGPIAEKELLALLESGDQGLKQTTIRVLEEIGTPESIPALIAVGQSGIAYQALAQKACRAIAERAR